MTDNHGLTGGIDVQPAESEVEPEVDELDIEIATVTERKPRAKRYRFRVDRTPYVLSGERCTVRELLIMAGKNPPEEFRFWKVISGESIELDPNVTVDLREPGLEKFRTLSRTQTEGQHAA